MLRVEHLWEKGIIQSEAIQAKVITALQFLYLICTV
jgi:hypothetical protein